MSITQKILFYYCLIFALFLLATGLANSKTTDQLLVQLVFLPIPGYLIFVLITNLIKKQSNNAPLVKLKRKSTILIILFFLILVATSIAQIWQKTSSSSNNSTNITTGMQSVQPFTAKELPTPTPQKNNYIIVKTDDEDTQVNIRSEASISAKIASKAIKDDKFLLIDTINEWYKILLKDNTIGYINKELADTIAED